MEQKYTLPEANKEFGKHLNNQTWNLLEKPDRTPGEDELMLHTAHASLYHWLQVGTGVQHQRGIWLIARVHAFLGDGPQALYYAERCIELTNEHEDMMEDFDIAFAWEGLARANAVAGNPEQAKEALEKVVGLADALEDAEDREIFVSELDSGNWYGVR